MKKRNDEDLEMSRIVAANLRKLINDKQLKQATLAEYAETSASQFSRMLNGELALSLQHIANIATKLHMAVIDIFTYPEKFVPENRDPREKREKVSVTFEVDPEKRDYLLRLVMGKKIELGNE